MIRRLRAIPPAELLLVGALVVLAFVIRLVGRHYVTEDMRIFYAWFDRLHDEGLAAPIGNYNAPFLYLFVLADWLPGATLIKIKAIFALFDVVLAYYAFRVVGLRYAGWRIPLAAAGVMVFLPTVVVNASMYGQCDSIWAAFALGGVYHLLRDRQWLGVGLFTAALAFKPQAIFIFPVLMLLLLAGRLRWRTLLAIPGVYIGLCLPAIVAGRDPVELLTLYATQGERTRYLTVNAPSIFTWTPVTVGVDELRLLGYAFAAVLVFGVCWALLAARVDLTAERILTVSTLFVIAVPFLLPAMHERYFYLGDVFTVVLAFYLPRLWYLPLIVQASSFLSYLGYLFSPSPGPFIDFKILTALMLAGVLITGHTLVRDLLTNRVPAPPPAPRREPAPDREPAAVV